MIREIYKKLKMEEIFNDLGSTKIKGDDFQFNFLKNKYPSIN